MGRTTHPRPLAVTMGDPAGIGGEITLKAWTARHEQSLLPFFLIDDPDRIAALARANGLGVPVRAIARADEAIAAFASALPVLTHPLAVKAVPGKADPANGKAIITAIDRAVQLVQRGEAAALVTNPIHKHSLYEAGFRAPGHTEYLAELAGGNLRPVMMLASPALLVVPVSVHVALARAVATLTTDALVTDA